MLTSQKFLVKINNLQQIKNYSKYATMLAHCNQVFLVAATTLAQQEAAKAGK